MSAAVINAELAEKFEKIMRDGRVVVFSAPCGFGKTTVAEGLLSGRKVLRLDAERADFGLPVTADSWDVLLIDSLQNMPERFETPLCGMIRDRVDKRFVLLTRGALPGYLAPFQFTGLLTVIDSLMLLLDVGMTRKLLEQHGVNVDETNVRAIWRDTLGYPPAIVIDARFLAAGMSYGFELIARTYQELFYYFETSVYHRFDLPIRRFLLELAPFEVFDAELARMVSGDARTGERLDWLQRKTTMLRYDDVGKFRFWPAFREFLLWEMSREYTEEKRRALMIRGGMYYELREDYVHALECYQKAGDNMKLSELLVRNAELHPGMGHYSEMEKYYMALSEREILSSPALMQGMSMLCALRSDYAGSERWYDELKSFAGRCEKTDAAKKQARGRLAWLDISLPQRTTENMIKYIASASRLITAKEINLPPFSVTSALPSIMNGGKDFSDWSRRDDRLYATMRVPVEAVLGRDGVGLADCAMAESKFEKGEDVSVRVIGIFSRLGEIQQRGTPDIEFAATAILARSQLDSGHAGDAMRTVSLLRERFDAAGQSRFLPNIDAFLCRIALHMGNADFAGKWYRDKAPRDMSRLDVMKRYQYMTQAMVELSVGRSEAALLTLAPLESYCRTCRRHIDGIHLNVLRAIALYRQHSAKWEELLDDALDEASEYRFIRTISVYGAAVLPLLESSSWDKNPKWLKKLMTAVRGQAANYPMFLRESQTFEPLTATEKQVLRLLCADKSNAEIGEILDIRISTVKTHVSHIFTKLGVSRRSEAKTAAQKLWLVSEDGGIK